MEYLETNNINVDDILSSWRMTDNEMDNYIMASRKSHHLFMPTRESLNKIMDEDENKLRILLTLNNNYFVITDNNTIIGVATIINNELVYVVPFKHQRKVMIIPIIREIMSKYDIEKTTRVEDFGKELKNELPKVETDFYNDEMNIIKRTIDILVNSGYQKEDILNDITVYMNNKTYQKK